MIMKSPYINYAMQEEKKACSVAILPWSSHQVNIVVLYKHVSNSIVIHNWILRLWITLKPYQKKKTNLHLKGKFFLNKYIKIEFKVVSYVTASVILILNCTFSLTKNA